MAANEIVSCNLNVLVHVHINWLQLSMMDPRPERPDGNQLLHRKTSLFIKPTLARGWRWADGCPDNRQADSVQKEALMNGHAWRSVKT